MIIVIAALVAGVLIGFLISHSRSSAKISALTVARDMEARNAQTLEEQYKRNLELMQTRQKKQSEQQIRLITEQLRTSSEEILIKRQEQLSASNKEQLASILNPLNANIAQMKEAVEHSKLEQSKTMASLQTAINHSFEQTKAVGESADRLASALTGENKTQGNFGELKLKELLDGMGLTEGLEYETQQTLRDNDGNIIKDNETGRRMIPDVILHFPDKRDMVIDSKISFKAFEDYQNADGEKERAEALKRHIASVRSHVKELKSKDYSKYLTKGSARLDFVIMYVFSEGALQLALSNDAALWRDAYDDGVLITGSQNMYALLRILEISWKQTRQAENQDKIIAVANEMVSRVQILCERLNKAEACLKKTQEAFEDVRTMAQPAGRSITSSANKLLKFGAKKDSRHAALPSTEE